MLQSNPRTLQRLAGDEAIKTQSNISRQKLTVDRRKERVWWMLVIPMSYLSGGQTGDSNGLPKHAYECIKV